MARVRYEGMEAGEALAAAADQGGLTFDLAEYRRRNDSRRTVGTIEPVLIDEIDALLRNIEFLRGVAARREAQVRLLRRNWSECWMLLRLLATFECADGHVGEHLEIVARRMDDVQKQLNDPRTGAADDA